MLQSYCSDTQGHQQTLESFSFTRWDVPGPEIDGEGERGRSEEENRRGGGEQNGRIGEVERRVEQEEKGRGKVK